MEHFQIASSTGSVVSGFITKDCYSTSHSDTLSVAPKGIISLFVGAVCTLRVMRPCCTFLSREADFALPLFLFVTAGFVLIFIKLVFRIGTAGTVILIGTNFV